jgi:TonB family protein
MAVAPPAPPSSSPPRPKPPASSPGETLRGARNDSPRRAWIVSAVVHGILVAALLYVFWKPARPARVEVFELVALETPKLRPLAPKTVEPPPPPEEKKIETRAPEAPKLTSTPTKPVPQSKPEPTKPPPPTADTSKSLPVKEVVRENANLSPVQVTNAPANSRMNFWAGRVKAKIEQKWNPPVGIDVDGPAKTVVRFNVDLDKGAISNVTITTSSGNKLLDEQAVGAVRRTETVPPPRSVLSPDFSEEFLQVSYEFIYQGH